MTTSLAILIIVILVIAVACLVVVDILERPLVILASYTVLVVAFIFVITLS